MLASPKRITRKDIRRPDQFVTLTTRLLHLIKEHRNAFVTSLALIIALSFSIWGWDLYSDHQSRLAAQEYSRAVTLYHTGKYLAALDALARLDSYRSSRYSRFGLLYKANAYIALKQTTKAAAALQEFLQRERKNPFLRQLGLITLAHTHEIDGKCKEANANFDEAQKIDGPLKEAALLGKARCSSQTGDLEDALKSYRQLLSSYPGPEGVSEIALRIQEIEAKIQERAVGK